MLKGIDPVLSPDLLWCLAAAGHGDDIALVEFVLKNARDKARAARAILSVLPIDDFTNDPIRRMQVVGDPAKVPDIQKSVQAEIDRVSTRPVEMAGIERFAFYEAAKGSFAIVQAGDPRGYGCFLFRKGVVFGDAPPL